MALQSSSKIIGALAQSNAEQAEEIYDLFQRSYQVEARLIRAADFPPLKRTKEHIQAASTRFMGYWLNSKLAAAVEYSCKDSHLSIDSLVVDPEYFRRGLASELLQALIRTLKWQTAEVETAAANEPALALYRRLGFSESRRWTTVEGIEKVQMLRSKTP